MPFNAAAHRCSDTLRLRAKQFDGLAQGVKLSSMTVGFAPLKPAEFVIIQIQQMAGQTAA